MGWSAGALPMLWAQAAGSATSSPRALALLALRRWCASLTLSPPDNVPNLFGLWAWLAGLAGLFAMALLFQGTGRALGQLADLPGHVRLVSAATRRFRKASRMLAAVIGLSVLSWTVSQALTYRKPEGREDVVLLTRSRHPVELAFEHGVLAALTPLRDTASLGSNLPLLVVATLLLFRVSAEVWGTADAPAWVKGQGPRSPGWENAGWSCGALLILYRLVSLASDSADLPLGGCLMVEALVVPGLMAVCDGLLLGWVLSELREAGFDRPDAEAFDTRSAVELLPASAVACVAALPARYLATAVWLAWGYVPTSAAGSSVGSYVNWQLLGHGLADVQGAGLLAAGMAGAVAWGSGGVAEAVRGYARLLAAEGARLVVVLGLAGLAAGVVSAAAYLVILSLPSAPWVLRAADSYAHYGTLVVGLWALAVFIELGERSLPEATLARAEAPTPPEIGVGPA